MALAGVVTTGMAGVFASASGRAAWAAEGHQTPTVIELFTSQGCASCPPADRLLGELVDRDSVIALTEAVDYWDYLGWKDNNALHANSERQRNYAVMRGDRKVYTPQMVINGRVHVVGSRREDVFASIKRLSSGAGALNVPISVETSPDKLTISIAARPRDRDDVTDGTLFLVPYCRKISVDIKRGENRGKFITYHNVADAILPLDMWHGEAVKVELPINEVRKGGHDGCAVLLQANVNGLPGPIYGATKIELPA